MAPAATKRRRVRAIQVRLGLGIGLLLPLVLAGMEGPAGEARVVSLVVEAREGIPAGVMREMRYEMGRLLGAAGLEVDWRMRGEVGLGVMLGEMVVVRFEGGCGLGARGKAAGRKEGAALASAQVTDGKIQRFAVVHCDRVGEVVRGAMWGSDFRRGEELMGRALARVLGHEVFHILGEEHEHDEEGLFKRALTGRELVAERLDFRARQVERLRQGPGAGAGMGERERVAVRD